MYIISNLKLGSLSFCASNNLNSNFIINFHLRSSMLSDLNYTLVLINYSAFEIWERYAVFQEQSTMAEIIQDSPSPRLLGPPASLGMNDSRTLLTCIYKPNYL